MKYDIRVDGENFEVEIKKDESRGGERVFRVDVSGREFEVAVKGEGIAAQAVKRPVFSVAAVPAAAVPAAPAEKAGGEKKSAAGGVPVEAPMAGKVVKIVVKDGDKVKPGDVLFILEAMKMENSIVSPAAGKVVSISVSVGDVMQKGNVMCTVG